MKVFTGEAPFGGEWTPAAITKIVTGKLPGRPDHPRFTDRLWELTQWCLESVPSNRPCMEEVLEALKDMVGSRGSSPGRVDIQPKRTLRSGTNEHFSRRAAGNSPLKQQPGLGGAIPRTLLLVNLC